MSTALTYQESLKRVVDWVSQRKPVTIAEIRGQMENHGLNAYSEKRRTKSIAAAATSYSRVGQVGRLRAALLIGVADLGPSGMTALERTGVLLADDQPPKKFSKFLTSLAEELSASAEPVWMPVLARIRSYQTYFKLSAAVAVDERKLVELVTKQPRSIVKDALALTQLSFLRAYCGYVQQASSEILRAMMPLT